MNNEKTRFTGKEPSDAIELENVELSFREKIYKIIFGFNEKLLPEFVQVRYLYRDGELEGGEKSVQHTLFGVWKFMI